MGTYANGKLTGKAWVALIGGGFLFGQVDKDTATISDDQGEK